MLGDPPASERLLPLHPLWPHVFVRQGGPGKPRGGARRPVLADRLPLDGRSEFLSKRLALADFRRAPAHLRIRDSGDLLLSRPAGSPTRLHTRLLLLV